MLHRYTRSNTLHSGYLNSKLTLYIRNIPAELDTINIGAGLYKVNSMLPEHGMILSSLTGNPSEINYQFHGKRQRRTVSLNTITRKLKI